MKHTLFWSFILASTNILCSQSDITINAADPSAYNLELIYDQVKIPGVLSL